MSVYVVLKRPGQPSKIIEAPEQLELEYLQKWVGGFVKVYPSRGHVSDVLEEVTLLVDEDGRRKDLPDNVTFPLEVVVGPVLACLADDAGNECGMPLMQAEAVAKALDHEAVALPN